MEIKGTSFNKNSGQNMFTSKFKLCKINNTNMEKDLFI